MDSLLSKSQPGTVGLDKPAILGGKPVFDQPLAFNRPTLPSYDSLSSDIESICLSGRLTNGPYVGLLEAEASDVFGRPAVALANCTSGLILTAASLGLTGQVIVPSFTFFATSHALLWNQLEPLFVDIDPETWNIDPAAVVQAINPKVSAIFAVDIFGNPSNKSVLEDIARKHGLHLVTDAAHALGAFYRGKPVGSFGDAEVFSLSPTKVMVAGEGGLIGVSDESLAAKLRIIRDYGNSGDYNCRYVGLNARMPEINARIALGGLEMLKQNIDKRNCLARRYRRNLSGVSGLTWQKVAGEDLSTYKDISILVDADQFGLGRDALATALSAEGIPTRKYFYPPAHEQAAYFGRFAVAGTLDVTDRISKTILSLPVWSHMTDDEVDNICAAIERIQAFSDGLSKGHLPSS